MTFDAGLQGNQLPGSQRLRSTGEEWHGYWRRAVLVMGKGWRMADGEQVFICQKYDARV